LRVGTRFHLLGKNDEDAVSGHPNAQEADFEQVSSNLAEGLKTCRSIVANYRAMLRDHQNPENDDSERADDELGDVPTDAAVPRNDQQERGTST
jgi:hypothetical protein